MGNQPIFEAEIIIDEKGEISIRNCNREILELMYQLNPNDTFVRKRIAIIRQTSKNREDDKVCLLL